MLEHSMNPHRILLVVSTTALCAINSSAQGQIELDTAPIKYSQAPVADAVAKLQIQLDKQTAVLEHDEEHGYLKSVLAALDIKTSSQVLVYSKTSFQQRKISPRRPRALYFNDHSYVGWVQGGDVLEIMSTDPQQGQVFYTLSQEKQEVPVFTRDRGQCIVCHASSRTQNVPGGLVRSAFVDAGGQPHYGSGTFTIDHGSPFEKRWGGWYVTGTHGKMRHMGNVVSEDRHKPETIDREAGANVTELSALLRTEPYLTAHSDIVALMVLEHQLQMQNYLTLASYETRIASHYNAAMNRALERPEDFVSDSTTRRIEAVGEKLVRYLLFAEEFRLTSPIRGTSGFAAHFQAQGPRDLKGRSLRDLDLETRLFKYPCSYLVYSPSFEQLPPAVKRYAAKRMKEILKSPAGEEGFEHLTAADRKSVLEILNETKPELWD